jgi:hypothetical protein
VCSGAPATAEDGTFHAAVPSRDGLEIRLHAAGHVDRDVNVEPGDEPVRLVLFRAGLVRFRLLPPRDVTERLSVIAHCLDDAGVDLKTSYDTCDADHLSVSLDVPVPTARVEVDVVGFLPVSRAVRPMLGKDVDLGEIALDDGAVVHGSVVDADSRPIEGASIGVFPSDGDNLLAWTHARDDGGFDVRGFAPGVVKLHVSAGGFANTVLRVAATKATDPVVVVLRRGGLVRASVVDASGAAVEFDELMVLGADGAPSDQGLDGTTTGCFAGHLPAGRWRLVATRGDVRAEETVDVVEGVTQDVVLKFAN